MGTQTAEALEAMIRSASNPAAGTTIIGLVAVFVAATGVFGEVQSAMNAIWKAEPQSTTLARFMWARLSSLALVVTSGFLLTASLAVSAALAALSTYLNGVFTGAELALKIADVVISIFLISGMFGAMCKVLPDTPIAWRDVVIGAIATTALFEGGKS